ncbi:MAG TPA: phosphoribosylamine--glycine ligase [Mycobacteriales bacterium]|nr:phosphoribosylamine--glycine ligase [Mycobacteriales bacterium]
MRVLVAGGGAREHALCLALAADPAVEALVCAPGNPGTAQVAARRPLDLTDPQAVATLAKEVGADLVVIGPEAPLVAGAADAVRAQDIACFGPSAAAARIEGSKAWAKDVMTAVGVPTAHAHVFPYRDLALAHEHLSAVAPPYVVKYDGLAGGKGVTVTDDLDVARRAVTVNLVRDGDQVVIEDYLDGPEVSLFAISDGRTVLPLLPAQDFKRLADGDEGPNTGGMGAYAPLPWLPDDFVDEVTSRILQPTVDELARRGSPFVGLLYAGLALTARGPAVVEFNARFGDPETQVVLPLLQDPLGELLHAAATGRLAAHAPLRWRAGAAVTVVIAAAGYPANPRTGDPLHGLAGAADIDGVQVLHAGTAVVEGDLVGAGGRVLSVTAVGDSLPAARDSAYAAVERISMPGAQHRSDIAAKAVAGEVAVPARS